MKINMDNIILDSDALLRIKAEDVSLPLSKEDETTLNDLLQYVINSRDPEISEKEGLRAAVGIAANQIGINKKLIAIVYEDDNEIEHKYALVNPKIISHSVQQSYLSGGEGCLSVTDVHEGIVPRHARVSVKAYDYLQNKEVVIKASGFFAIILQHEIDHFNGVLFYDRINKNNPFEKPSGALEI